MVPTALSESSKETVRPWVLKVRRLAEDDIAAQLERLGFSQDGRHQSTDQLNLAPAALDTRRRVEALLRREALAEGGPTRAFDAVQREVAYTFLNRLLGIKCLEVRGLLFLRPPLDPGAAPEQTEVLTPVQGQERSRYLRDLRTAGGARYKYADNADELLLKDGLLATFGELTEEIRVLFDPDADVSALWPTYACLAELIRRINSDLTVEAYQAADFLGWVYQYFQVTENKRIRDEFGGTPRTSYELAVINQSYSPGWLVKTLVDNTLGRLWLQMHPDSSLAASIPGSSFDGSPSGQALADYLVPRTGERIPFRDLRPDGEVVSFKPVKDITLLDPACGTMHFGVYALALFYRMYEEEIDRAGQPGWPAAPSVAEARDIPAAIVEHNLFGIDIDPRAIQIAALSLLMSAKDAARHRGIPPTDVRIRQANLVVANAVDLGETELDAAVGTVAEGLFSLDLQKKLLRELRTGLAHLGELGSLVQIREGINRVLDEWVQREAKRRGIAAPFGQDAYQTALFPDAEVAHQRRLTGRLLAAEADALRRELLAGLEHAAATAGLDAEARLFAEDTARELKLVQVLSRHYDVVVMNPPYGSFVPAVKEIVKAAYPLTANDIYATFIERACQLVEPAGYVGALVSSTFITHTTFRKLRTEILLKRHPLIVLLDLGPGVLERTVRPAAIVLKGAA